VRPRWRMFGAVKFWQQVRVWDRGEEVGRMTREPDARWEEGGGMERLTRVRGLDLPGLKRWRMHRGLTQQELAKRVDVLLQYVMM
jgi:hypothetical protein